MTTLGNIIKLDGTLQHAQWGGREFIPELFKLPNTVGRPFSEVQFDAQSPVSSAQDQSLEQLIQQYPGIYLGKKSLQAFGPKLPFILRILDVDSPLSIHVHPNKQQAENGFAREQACGIGLTSPYRTYKDTNHKPEFIVALTDFWQLHGLRSMHGIQKTFQQEPSLEKLLEPIKHGGTRLIIESILNLDESGLDTVLTPLIEKYMTSYRNQSLPPTTHHYWVMHCTARTLLKGEPLTPGILLIYAMNLVHIPPGGSVYTSPSTMHAHLKGQAIEVCANSQNILRIGLTSERIDQNEFFKVAHLNPSPAEIIYGIPMPDGGLAYKAPIHDFKLNQYHWQADSKYTIPEYPSPRFWFIYEGHCSVQSEKDFTLLSQSEMLFQKPNTPLSIQTSKDCRIFMVTTEIT